MTHRCLMKILALGKRNDFLVSINPSLITAVPMFFSMVFQHSAATGFET